MSRRRNAFYTVYAPLVALWAWLKWRLTGKVDKGGGQEE